MIRGSFFKKLLLYLLCACVLTALLTGLLYGFSSVHVLSDRVAADLLSRAVSLSYLCSKQMNREILFDSFYAFMSSELRGARIYIYDAQGSLLLWSKEDTGSEPGAAYQKIVSDVLLTGDQVTNIIWHRGLIAVGVPIYDNLHRVSGAVVLAKRAAEVRESIRKLFWAMPVSACVAALIMLLPAYFGSRRIASPIQQMTQVATQMANGDFGARADETYPGEVGQLSGALNHLSSALSATIGDLVLARNRLSAILEGIGDGVVAFDSDLKTVIFSNPAAERLMQDCGDALSCQALAERFHDDFVKAASSAKPVEVQFPTADRIIHVACASSQTSSGGKPGIVVLLRDITEAERLEQTRREYVANVSHELRTPIASIRSLAETLNDGLIHSEEDKSRYYGYILRESMRLSRLINDLLELSRLQSGSVALVREAFDMNELLCQVAERMRVTASYSDIDLQYEENAALPACLSNRDRIEQVLIALVDNAIKYASDDGQVLLTCSANERELVVEVRNSGHIEEADLPHIFERFYKADKSHTGLGTGLGLAIAREILQQLDGTICASNEGDFVVFRFTVPHA